MNTEQTNKNIFMYNELVLKTRYSEYKYNKI